MMGSDLTGTGSNGAETLYSSGGPNTLVGLGGDDLYYVNNAADVVIEAPAAASTLCLRASTTPCRPNAEGLYMIGLRLDRHGHERCRQSTHRSGGPNTLVGLGGDDHLLRQQYRRRGESRLPTAASTPWSRPSITRCRPATRSRLSICRLGIDQHGLHAPNVHSAAADPTPWSVSAAMISIMSAIRPTW